MPAKHELKFGIYIPVRSINTLLKWVVGINLFFLFGTWLHAEEVIFAGSTTLQWFLAELNLAKENVVAAWYSSMLFLSTGIVAALCFWADMLYNGNSRQRYFNYGWLIMAAIFCMLSFDEMGSFHEMIGQTALFKKAGSGIGGGKYLFFGLIGAVAIFMLTFFFLKFRSNRFALLLTVIGVLLFLSNPLQEKFEISSWRNSPDPDNWHRPFTYLLLEEGSEIFASFCFLFSFITYAVNTAKGASSANENILKLESPVHKNFIAWFCSAALLLGVGMWLIHANAWNMAGDDNGLPQDWPPAAMAFAGFVFSLYLYFKKDIATNRYVYLLIALTAIFTSVYFGAYLYGYFQGPFVRMPYLLLVLTFITGLVAVFKLPAGMAAKLFFIAWVILTALSVFARNFSSSVYGYAACGCLLTGLFLHYKNMHQPVTNRHA